MNDKLKLLIDQIINLLHPNYYGKVEIGIENSQAVALNITESVKFKKKGQK